MIDYFEEMRQMPIAFINMTVMPVTSMTAWNGQLKWKYQAKLGFMKWTKYFDGFLDAEADRDKMLEAIEKCKQLGKT